MVGIAAKNDATTGSMNVRPGEMRPTKRPPREPHRDRHQHAVAALEIEERHHDGQADDERRREHPLDDERDQHPGQVETLLLVAALELLLAGANAPAEAPPSWRRTIRSGGWAGGGCFGSRTTGKRWSFGWPWARSFEGSLRPHPIIVLRPEGN